MQTHVLTSMKVFEEHQINHLIKGVLYAIYLYHVKGMLFAWLLNRIQETLSYY